VWELSTSVGQEQSLQLHLGYENVLYWRETLTSGLVVNYYANTGLSAGSSSSYFPAEREGGRSNKVDGAINDDIPSADLQEIKLLEILIMLRLIKIYCY